MTAESLAHSGAPRKKGEDRPFPPLEEIDALTFSIHEDNYLLQSIDKIIKKRWRFIVRTTRYGWLAACSNQRSVSAEDAKTLSALAGKIGPEDRAEAIDRIEKISENLHPKDIPAVAVAVLTETQTAVMLRQRKRSKLNAKLVIDRFPTIFTISDAYSLGKLDSR